MEKKSNIIYYGLFFLLTSWFSTILTHGSIYRCSLYLLYVIAIVYPPIRCILIRIVKDNKILLFLLLIPPLFSMGNYLNTNHFSVTSFESIKIIYDYALRFVLISAVISSVIIYLKLSVKNVIFLVLFSAILHSGISLIVDFSNYIEFLLKGISFRASGLAKSPNEFGGLVAIGAGISFVLLIMSSDFSVKNKLFFSFSLVVTLFSLIFSQSRGALLAFSGSTIIYCFVYFLSKKSMLEKKRFITICLIVSLLLIGLSQMEFFQKRFVERGTTDPARLFIWKHFLSVWIDNFWFGVYSIREYPALWIERGINFRNPHNTYIDIAVRTGFFGLTTFGYVIFSCIKSFWKDDKYKDILIAFISIILLLTLVNWSVYSKEFSQSIYAIVLSLHIIISYGKKYAKEQ